MISCLDDHLFPAEDDTKGKEGAKHCDNAGKGPLF
jgi:hypothetical protein